MSSIRYNYNSAVYPASAPPHSFPGSSCDYGYQPWAPCYGQSPPPPTSEDASGTGTKVSGSVTVTLKVLSPQNKRNYQHYSLHNIVPATTSTPEEMREDIRVQVGEAVSGSMDFLSQRNCGSRTNTITVS